VKPRREKEVAFEESPALLEEAEEARASFQILLIHRDRS
jgi:hypothetical protein